MRGLRSRWLPALAAIACLLLGHEAALAQTSPSQTAQRSLSKIDPGAIASLTRMGDYVASLTSFEISARMSIDAELANGQKILIDGTSRYRARRPDRLQVDLDTEFASLRVYYDGKAVTIMAPPEPYYVQVPAKPTIKEMLEQAAKDLDVEIPLADLFDWGTPDAPVKRIESAFFVGTSKIRDAETEHWAIRSGDLDWEVWLRTGDQPLPLKVSIVDRSAPSHPRVTSDLTWTVNPQLPDDLFAFRPPPDARQVEFLDPSETQQGAQ